MGAGFGNLVCRVFLDASAMMRPLVKGDGVAFVCFNLFDLLFGFSFSKNARVNQMFGFRKQKEKEKNRQKKRKKTARGR